MKDPPGATTRRTTGSPASNSPSSPPDQTDRHDSEARIPDRAASSPTSSDAPAGELAANRLEPTSAAASRTPGWWPRKLDTRPLPFSARRPLSRPGRVGRLPLATRTRSGAGSSLVKVSSGGPMTGSAADSYTSFVEDAGPRLRQALIARYGPDVGAEATAEALAYGWEHWDRLASMANPAGYLCRVGQSRSRAFFRARRRWSRRSSFPAPSERCERPIRPSQHEPATLNPRSTSWAR